MGSQKKKKKDKKDKKDKKIKKRRVMKKVRTRRGSVRARGVLRSVNPNGAPTSAVSQ